MKFKQLTLTFCFIIAVVFCNAQNKEQEGLVKTRGRLDGEGKVIPGVALQNASIILKGGNSALSEKNGDFSIMLPEDKYYLQNVEKEGYEVVDQDILSKQYVYSKNPLVLVMDTPGQQLEDELAAERKIRRTLTRQLHEREDEIERLKEENKISIEQYREELNKLYDAHENNEQLISDMAERYSKIDFDQIDEFYVQVSNYILNGELTKADSMLNTKGNIGSDIESLNQLKEINAKERAELNKRQKKLEKSEAMAQHQLEDIAQRCYSKYEIFKMQHQNDSALYYLELRASLDTTNVEWMMAVGEFARKIIADYDKAMEYCNKALNIVCEKDTDKLSVIYHVLGLIYSDMSQYEKSIELFNKVLKITDSIYGMNSPESATVYLNLGSQWHKKEDYHKALEFYYKALDVIENANVLHNIALTYHTLSNIDKAKEFYDRLQNIIQDDNNYENAYFYNGIGSFYSTIDDFEKSLDLFDKSIEIFKLNNMEEHPYYANINNNIAGVLAKDGQYEKAIEHYLEALVVFKNSQGNNNVKISTTYNNIAVVYNYIGDYKSSNDYLQKSIDCLVNFYSEENRRVAGAYHNLGMSYINQEDYNKALEYLTKAYNIRKSILGMNNLSTLNSYNAIGGVYSERSEYKKAIEYFEVVLNIRKELLGENHTLVSNSYNNIGMAYDGLREYDKALEYLYKSVEINEIQYGVEHISTLLKYNNIGTILLSKKDYEMSLDYLTKALSGYMKLFGGNNIYVANVYVNIAKCYNVQENYPLALEYYNKALDILKNHYPDKNDKIESVETSIKEINSICNK